MDSRIYMLVHKELTGEMTPSEAEELRSLQASQGGEDLSQDISLIWNVSKDYFPKQDWDKSSAKSQFLDRLKSEQSTSTATSIKNKATSIAEGTKASSSPSSWKIGVGILAFLALAFLGYQYFSNTTVTDKNPPPSIQAEEEIIFAVLGDDTKVWLSPGSSIKDEIMTDQSRSVTLEGEAFFDVTHDPSRRFNISLGDGVNIEVLGTSFKVSSADANGKGLVSVRDGSVRLYSTIGETANIKLKAGETGELNARQPFKDKYRTDKVLTLGSIEDLSLKNLPLNKVFDKLGDYYGVNFKLDDAKLDCRFNSPLTGDPTINQVVNVISAVYTDLNIELKDRSIYQVSGSCK